MSVVTFLVPSTWDQWRSWLQHDAPDLASIVVLLLVAHFVFRTVVSRVLHGAITRAARARIEDTVALERRSRTLVLTLDWSFTIFLIILGSTLILDNLGLNVSALVAGIGVVGIAVGLGAQTLIKDVINGTFILIEDQYSVGDVVSVAGVTGEVVAINPRRTVVRDMNGSLHSIPNGSITVATNMTQGFSRINLDLSLPGTQDITQAIRLIDAVGQELAKERAGDVLSAPHVLRIDAIGETRVGLKVVADTRPGKQWELTGELRRRLLERLKEEGIDLFLGAPVAPPPVERDGSGGQA